MIARFAILSLALCTVSAVRVHTPEVYPRTPSPTEIARLLREGDGETRLALGEKLDLARASVFELELISGVSDRLAGRLIEQKGAIIAQASLLPPERRWVALTLVHGIGPKTAQKLSHDIDISGPGSTAPPEITP